MEETVADFNTSMANISIGFGLSSIFLELLKNKKLSHDGFMALMVIQTLSSMINDKKLSFTIIIVCLIIAITSTVFSFTETQPEPETKVHSGKSSST